ncbi:hypothetical protein DACRYDRAFT_110124 [Dacryopinax primogenitus]|uniref:Uncharacterized protein n=1 Tax=Dacryopinax primogenitus (strain DJM 731) TaxID=1858805 RepID=M5G0P3_DACPD|nr:uncharacterized protein DACRYDRAFT_110124 [Dacryopinax primogenitus]EJT99401.1 hypothetical protein DACRYDRAFT_110124 [Dacryopinax primogenitus]
MAPVRSDRRNRRESVSPLAAVRTSRAEETRIGLATLRALLADALAVDTDTNGPRSHDDPLAAKVTAIRAIDVGSGMMSLKTPAMKLASSLALLANQAIDFPKVAGPGTYNGKPHEPMPQHMRERLKRGEDRGAQEEYNGPASQHIHLQRTVPAASGVRS